MDRNTKILSMKSSKKNSGIEILGDMVWGTHFCLFYETKEDLLDILIPYFKAGLENNEYCMWVTSEPLDQKNAEEALRKALPDFNKYLKKKQIEIIPPTEWYLKDEEFDLQRVLNDWVEKLNDALARGYDGMRATGNNAWLEKENWQSFTDYEEKLNAILPNFQMMAICTYQLEKCGPFELLDVIRNHQFAVMRREGKWEMFKSMEQLKAEQKLKESEDKSRYLFENSPFMIVLVDLEGKIIDINSTTIKKTDYHREDLIGKDFREVIKIIVVNQSEIIKKQDFVLKEGFVEPFLLQATKKDGNLIWIRLQASLVKIGGMHLIQFMGEDVTEQKAAEEAFKESEEKYKKLMETSEMGLMEINIQTNELSYVNPKFLEISGYTPEEIQKPEIFYKMIHPDDLTKFSDSKEEQELEYRIFTKDGRIKWLSGKKVFSLDAQGNLTNIRMWVKDVTEKKNNEFLIEAINLDFLKFTDDYQENIRLLLSTCRVLLNADFVVYSFNMMSNGNPSHEIISSNANDNLMAYDFEEFNKNLFLNEFFYENHDSPQTFLNIREKKYVTTDPFLIHYNINGAYGKLIKSQNKFNSCICAFFQKNPVPTRQDQLVLFLICEAIEIELRRWQTQLKLEEQNKRLNEISNLKTELFSRSSHELKTPLISIKGFTDLLLNLHSSQFNDEVISIIKEIKIGCVRLEKLINIILTSSCLQNDLLNLNKSLVNLALIIRECEKELKGFSKTRNQAISSSISEEVSIHVDKERIREVISNLLLNAVKYTPPGGAINISSEIKDSFIIVAVKDNGIGVTEEEKKHLFMQFGKVERYGQGLDVEIEGSGLGLYISKKIVELHGGEIWVESEGRHKGSTFFFSLPLK